MDLVYLNGDSYSSPSDSFKIYGEYIAEHYNSDFINHSIRGSSNNRIFRSSLRDLIDLKKKYKNILACVSLTFIMRTDLWDTSHKFDRWRSLKNNDGDFLSLQPFTKKNWNVNSLFSSNISNESNKYNDFCKNYAIWYDIEAETTKLLEKIILFSNWCENNKIKYLIFSPMYQEKIDFSAPFIKDFYHDILNNNSILNPFEFSFLDWCLMHNYKPIDNFEAVVNGKTFQVGHQGKDGHKAFSKFLLENYFQNT
jgi:hypothetical protein